jgi:hypothetical protein
MTRAAITASGPSGSSIATASLRHAAKPIPHGLEELRVQSFTIGLGTRLCSPSTS